MILLTNCAVAASDPVYMFRCPPLVSYPPEVQAKAADEIKAMPPGAVIPGFISDYGILRKKCRVLEKKTPPASMIGGVGINRPAAV